MNVRKSEKERQIWQTLSALVSPLRSQRKKVSFLFILHKCHRAHSRCKLNFSDIEQQAPFYQPGTFNLWGQPRHPLFGLWTPELFLQIKRPFLRHFAVSWTTEELFVRAAELGYERLGILCESQVSSAVWGEFFCIWWELDETLKFVPWLFVYSLYTFSGPDALKSFGL